MNKQKHYNTNIPNTQVYRWYNWKKLHMEGRSISSTENVATLKVN